MNVDALIKHLRTHSLRTDGPFTLRSGEVSDWYLDARQTTYSGTGSRLVGEAMLGILAPSVVGVGGLTMGADPVALATAIAAADQGRALRAFSIRKQDKHHGTGGRLVGPIQIGDLVAVVDDTVTTGGALFEAVDVLESEGIEVKQVAVLVDRSKGLLEQRCRERNLPYISVLRPQDLGVE